MIVFEAPTVLAFVLFLNLWAVLSEISDSRVFKAVRRLASVNHRLSVRAAPTAIPVLIALAAWLTLRGPVQTRIWETGCCGEPPDNRFVAFKTIPNDEGQLSAVVEFGVRYTRIERFVVRVDFEEQIPQRQWPAWIDHSNLVAVPPGDKHVVSVVMNRIGSRSYTRFLHLDTLKPGQSFYVDLGGEERTVTDCYFSSIGVWDDPAGYCGRSVDVYDESQVGGERLFSFTDLYAIESTRSR